MYTSLLDCLFAARATDGARARSATPRPQGMVQVDARGTMVGMLLEALAPLSRSS